MSQDKPGTSDEGTGTETVRETRFAELQDLVQTFSVVCGNYEQFKEAFELYAQTVYLVEIQLEDVKGQIVENYGMFTDLQSEVEKMLREGDPGVDFDKDLLDARFTQVKRQLLEIEMNFETLKCAVVRANIEHGRLECMDDDEEEDD